MKHNSCLFVFSVIAIFLLQPLYLQAQLYTTALGLRLSQHAGITLQQQVGKRITVEGMLQHGLLSNQTIVTVLLQKHMHLITKGINMYAGAGPHLTWYPMPPTLKGGDERASATGLSLLAELEAAVGRTLIAIDYKPAFNFGAGIPVYQGEVGLSLRYVLVKQWKSKKSRTPAFLKKDRRSA
jgi:hypothetical protein